jgi:hypothetical protein
MQPCTPTVRADASPLTRVSALAAIGMMAHKMPERDGGMWLAPASETVLAALAEHAAPPLLQLAGLSALSALSSLQAIEVTSSWASAATLGLQANDWRVRASAAVLIALLFSSK